MALMLAGAGAVAAHPLGNFTINHYAGLVIEPERVTLDVVIDEAEIPAFQSIRAIDVDGDGTVSDAEAEAAATDRCGSLMPELDLRVGPAPGAATPLESTAAELTMPLGPSGIATLRVECGYAAMLGTPLPADGATRIAFADRSRVDRLGWREIVAVGSGVRLEPVEGELRPASISGRLTAYPPDLVLLPLRDRSLVVEAIVDPDVGPVGSGPDPVGGTPPDVAEPLPSIFQSPDLTPVVLIASLLTALLLGAWHALTPGHGKALMAAYLIGTRGQPLHAIGLGLSVSASHTAGILLLAAVVVGAADLLPPDLVVRVAPVVAAVSILGIGAWMLAGEWQRRRSRLPRPSRAHGHRHEDGRGHAHGHGHAVSDTTVTWRSLFVLGLAGGLIPSTSALLILLGSIAAGRPAFGFVLVVTFGLGMAAVLTGIGLLLVLARERLDRVRTGPVLDRVRAVTPLLAAAVVFGFGVLLTAQAVAALRVG